MNIYAKNGDRVKYIGCDDSQMNYGGNDDPRDILVIGGTYSISKTEVHSWHTKIYLIGLEKYKFNSVCFEDA